MTFAFPTLGVLKLLGSNTMDVLLILIILVIIIAALLGGFRGRRGPPL